MRLVRSNLRRLVRRPATLVTYLLLAGLMVLLMLAVAAAATQAADPQSTLASRLILTFPGAWMLILSMTVGFGGLLGLMYGAAIAGSEWTWGTLKGAVARGERRAWYAVAGILGTVFIAWAGTLVAYAAGVVGAIVAASVASVPHPTLIDTATLGELVGQLGRAALAIAMDVSVGFAVATIARSQLAGIGAGIGLYLGEGVIGIFLPGIVKWAPFAAASAMMAGSEGGLGSAAASVSASRLDPDLAIIVVAAWFLVATAIAALWTERAEIGG
jgi:hypothetical protein